ncbi:SusC/RagA family TonB-linked outer membrane protein [Pedobacter sp. AW31-3R]|uniref:SusC/RagA family TonB-linked outer membrane protein n=1 Tax=Pedobacter sp. AW31-3R TaxID=3445781 RepID=UPI003FA04447
MMSRVILFLAFFYLTAGNAGAQAQSRPLTGTVTDQSDGQPLVGVSVSIKDTKNGVSTDGNGHFKITIPAKGAILSFSYIGYKNQLVTVTSQQVLNIKLAEDASTLKEVNIVNIGYGTVRKEALTGSVSSLSGKDLATFPVGSAAQALTGKLAGVSVVTTEGSPGAEIQVKVRGGSSLTGDNAPLYIVDGIQVENALSILSPNEIEKIDVLKDVASTAIYGSRGANGVVIITTKGGKNGRTIVSFDAFSGVRKITNTLEVMNPYEFVSYQYELYHNNTSDEVKKTFLDKYGTFESLANYKNLENINWQDKVFGRSAWSDTEILNLSGGTDKTTYNFTLNNTQEDGIMLNSGFKRTFASFRFDHKISDKLRTGINVRYSRQRIDGVGTSSTGSTTTNRLRNSVRYQPYAGEGESGDLFDSDYLTTYLTNPITLANDELKYDYRNDLISSGYLNYQILKNLSFRTTIGANFTDRKTNIFNGVVSYVGRNNGSLPAIQLDNSSQITILNTNTLNYKPDLGEDHTLDLLVGEELNKVDIKSNSSIIKWFPASITADEAFGSTQRAEPPVNSVQDKPTSLVSGTRQLSFFGRASYGYKGRYLATVNFRRDGSSLFAKGNQWGNFPSAQVAWRITEEKFLKDMELNWLNNLKLRVSYGAAGNNRIGQDLFRILFSANSVSGGYAASDGSITTGVVTGTVLTNPDITWETNISRNAGLDIDLFHSKLSASVDLYDNRTQDLLLNANIPQTTGYLTQQQNVGKTQNKGIEFQLTYNAVNNDRFSYSTSFNLSFNRNKILELQNGVSSYITQSGWVNSLGDYLVEVGKPVGQYYGYVSDGRYTVADFNYTQNATTGVYTYTLKSDVPNNSTLLGNRAPQPGDMKVKKLSSSSSMTITEDDKTVLGTAQPKFTGGFNNQFAYKNFDLTVFVNFSYGSKVYNANKVEFTSQYNMRDNNLLAIMNDRWKNFDANGVQVTDPAALTAMNANTTYWTPTLGDYNLTSFAIESGSFLRISNVTLGYSLPEKFIKRSKLISKLRVYGTVNNLLTITGYDGYDPEASTRRSNPFTPGVDYAAYPRSRFILAGINMVF